jgi:uncharacterized protein YodC (DUF2158 family)
MFKIGDVVVLKSGGPKMTICGLPVENISRYHCEWFDDSGELKRSRFPREALMAIIET